MKNLNLKFVIIPVMVIVSFSCRDESKLPYNYEEQQYGAYAKVIEVVSGSFIAQDAPGYPLDAAASEFSVTLEVRDVQKGGLFKEYEFFVTFVDNNPPTLDLDEVSVGVFPASLFTKDPSTGYPRATLTVEAVDVINALGITQNDVRGGDVFEFRHVLRLKDGREFTNTNTSGVVTGGAFFNAPMFHAVSVLCPSDLVGNYNGITNWIDYYGAPGSNTYSVNITRASGAGQYNLPDLSGGMEPIVWSNPPVAAVFEDVCGKINLVSAPYAYGYLINGPTNTFGNNSNVNPGTGVITIFWENVFAEYGRTVLTPN